MRFRKCRRRPVSWTVCRLRCGEENGHFRFDTIISFNRQVEEEQIERLRESIWNAVADGQITDQELEYINSFYLGSELSQEDFEKLRAEIFTQVVQQAIADRRIVEGELNSVNHLIMATSDISTPDANSVAFMDKDDL